MNKTELRAAMRRPPAHQQRPCFREESTAFEVISQEEARKQKQREGLCEALHVLNGGNEEALLAHVLDAEHTGITEAMIFLGLRKRPFNGFLAPLVKSSANTRLGEDCNIIQRILPNMTFHHPSLCFAAEALFPHRTGGAFLWVAVVLSVPLLGRRFPVEQFFGGAEICIVIRVVMEAPFPPMVSCVRMSAVSDDTLNSFVFQQMRHGSIMITRVQPHVGRQRAQTVFNFIQYFRQRRYI